MTGNLSEETNSSIAESLREVIRLACE